MKADIATETGNSARPTGDDAFCEVDPTVDADWDAALLTHGEGSFFHGAEWARVMQGTYGFKPFYFELRNSDRTESLVPMMEVNSWITGKRGISLPFTDECEPIYRDVDALRRLHERILKFGRQRSWKYVEFRGGPDSFFGVVPSLSYWGHRLDLRGGEKELWTRLDASVRRAIRKAEKSALAVEFSSDFDAVRTFYSLFCLTRRRHGTPPQPFEFFENIHRHVLSKNLGWVVLAKARGLPVAGAMYFHFGKSAIYKFGASDENAHLLRANNLVMWEAIRRYSSAKFDFLDFGRTSLTNVGLQRYKRNWGTVERRINYFRQDCQSGAIIRASDASTGIGSRVVGALPGSLFNLLGRLLYRHIA